MRISSPLARVLVVFFLTLCALASLGSYVIANKIVRDKIIRQGGDMVVATLMPQHDVSGYYLPTQKDIRTTLGAESYILLHVGSAQLANRQPVSIYTCQFSRLNQIMPLLSPGGGPTLIQSEETGKLPPGPSEVTIRGQKVDIYVRNLPETHPLLRMMHGSGLLVQPEFLPHGFSDRAANCLIALIFPDLENAEPIRRAEEFLRTYKQLERLNGPLISALPLLKELDVALSKQMQCRIAFCVGITAIVGILLTALAGMEYRQNEYIYTLMKSFGIHPFLLVGAFITENLLIIGASFVGAIATFMYFQRMIITQILKLGSYSLTLEEISPEICLISYTLLGCVLLSAFPILVAANRPIGRVLK